MDSHMPTPTINPPRLEEQAPLGEPSPPAQEQRTTFPAARQPADLYALVSIRPAYVKQLRPRWSEARCRRWLATREHALTERMRDALLSHLLDYLDHTAGATLRRDRVRMPTLQTEPGTPDYIFYTNASGTGIDPHHA